MSNLVRLLILGSFLATFAACGDSPPEPITREPEPEPEPEPFAEPDGFGFNTVGHVSFTVVDEARDDRSVLVDLWYPVDQLDTFVIPLAIYKTGVTTTTGQHFTVKAALAVEDLLVSRDEGRELLVFSHDFDSLNTQSTLLMEMLASHGFIVASPEHTGSTGAANSDPSDDETTAASHRVADVSLVIDAMLERSATARDSFEGRVDGSRVGVVGHAFGGLTSLGTAAGWAGGAIDERVKALVPISASMDGTFSNTQLASIELPALLLGGTEDTVVPINNNAIAFERMTGSPALYNVGIIGATHEHFRLLCANGDALFEALVDRNAWGTLGVGHLLAPYDAQCGPEADEVLRLQNLYTVAFFRRHLRDETAYAKYLTAEYATANEPAINLEAR
jgi:predicted dienelactone hydrolase